jgi:hypothetical protein
MYVALNKFRARGTTDEQPEAIADRTAADGTNED